MSMGKIKLCWTHLLHHEFPGAKLFCLANPSNNFEDTNVPRMKVVFPQNILLQLLLNSLNSPFFFLVPNQGQNNIYMLYMFVGDRAYLRIRSHPIVFCCVLFLGLSDQGSFLVEFREYYAVLPCAGHTLYLWTI